jgi:hypothetical protein
MTTLSGIQDRIRDKLQEYSKNWLTDDMLTDIINYSIKHIATISLVFKKLYNVTISNTNIVPLPDDFINSISLKIGTNVYPKKNYEDMEFIDEESKYHYIVNGTLYLSHDASGDVEMMYNYIPDDLEDADDELDQNFKGFVNCLVTHCVSEVFGMDGDTERQAFNYNVFRSQMKTFIKTKTNVDNGRALFKKIDYRNFWDNV